MKKEKQAEKFIFPSEEEISAAQRACCGKNCTACETPAGYAWRKRDVDMALLLERAIRLELTDAERDAIIMHWYDNESISKIASNKGISPAAVTKTLNRAKEKLERVLSYTVCYQQNTFSESIIPLVIGRARVIAAARNAKGGTMGDRIARLRQSQCISHDSLSKVMGISASRLMKIEHGREMNIREVISFSEFFDVSADFILKGETDDEKKNIA